MSTQNCLIFTRYYFIYIYLIPTINHKTRRYCLSSALNSNVKPPQDGGPRLGKHFWRGTWRCWHTGTTPRGRRVSFGSDSELLSARSQLPHRWLPLPRLAQGQFVSPPRHWHPAGGKASQLPCGVSFRQCVSTRHRPSTEQRRGRGCSLQVGGRADYKQKVRIWTCSMEMYPTHPLDGNIGRQDLFIQSGCFGE